jgi:nucleotide-binding universal stress UspA family protein
MAFESHRARRHRVVVGYDGSDVSGAAVAWAGERVGQGGKLVVVYSRPSSDPVDEPALRATLEVHAGPALAAVEWELELPEGDPARQLASMARAHDADELVVGLSTSGRTPLHHDGISQKLLRTVDRPVVIVPGPR